MFLNTGSGAIDIFEVKFTFEMLTARGRHHSFSAHERMFSWKCQSFWDRKGRDLSGTRTLNLRIHAESSNHFSHEGQPFAAKCFWILVLMVQIDFKLTFELLTVRGHQYSFSTRTDVLVKVSIFLRKKMSRSEGDSNPRPSDSCPML